MLKSVSDPIIKNKAKIDSYKKNPGKKQYICNGISLMLIFLCLLESILNWRDNFNYWMKNSAEQQLSNFEK